MGFHLRQNLRFAFRMLIKMPGFSVITLLTLALGMGANTAIFSVLNSVVLRPLPYHAPEHLFELTERSNQLGELSVSYPNFLDWQARSQSFQSLAAHRFDNFKLSDGQIPERVNGRQVSGQFFETLGVKPLLGRLISAVDDQRTSEPATVISYGLWQRRFAAEPGVLGRVIKINDRPYTVIGVLPQSFRFYGTQDVFVPLAVDAQSLPWFEERSIHPGMFVVGRVKPGISVQQATSEINSIMAQIMTENPNATLGHSVTLTPLQTAIIGNSGRLLWTLLGAVGLVLLIACVNVANLLIARSTIRQKEIAIRLTLGAGRRQIVSQLLTESLVISFLGGMMGILLAVWGTEALTKFLPDTLRAVSSIVVDWRVAVFAGGLSVFTGVLFGLTPALQLVRVKLNDTLKEHSRSFINVRHRARSLFVVAEVALSLVLLVGAGLLLKSFLLLQKVDLGFKPNQLLTFQLTLSKEKLREGGQILSFSNELLRATSQLPGVQSAALTSDVPISGGSEAPFKIVGRPVEDRTEQNWAVFYSTTPDYLKTMQIPVREGRGFTEQDTAASRDVVLIDEAFARQYFPTENPIGKKINIADIKPDCEIVGIVGHIKHYGLDEGARDTIKAQLYLPFAQIPEQFFPQLAGNLNVLVRTEGDPSLLIDAIRTRVNELDRDIVMFNTNKMETIVSQSLGEKQVLTILLGIFALVAVTLAAIGVYGVLSFWVSLRVPEIGLRLALGASPIDVVRLVARFGGGLVLSGIFTGIMAAWGLSRLISNMLFEVSSSDPMTYAVVSLGFLAIAGIACLVPAIRAARVDPLVALRSE
ncbi:MAG TPA: ABC transporter permease [Acidobacteriota bacterium]|nr:ABC transporter permease [Acidobacteriota bacterium]